MSTSESSLYSPFSEGGSDSGLSETSLSPPALPARNTRTMVPQDGHHGKEPWYDSPEASSSGSFPDSGEINGGTNTFNLTQPPKSSRPRVPPPPRPPPRSLAPVSCESPSTLLAPPPLPSRRVTAVVHTDPQIPPRLPTRPHTVPGATSPLEPPLSPANSVKLLGTSRLPPPPTRTIALGDKLPPARRPPSPSSEEDSGDEDDSKSRSADSLPDSSRSSRRPPVLSVYRYTERQIHVPAYTGHVAVSGEYVLVGSQSHVKVFNLSQSDSPLYSLHAKDVGLKDLKVTAMEFRPSENPVDSGSFLWLGTKDGHLLEMDIRTSFVVGTKLVAHSQPVSHIFRHGRSMITVDQGGKTLVFTPEAAHDLRLGMTQPRVVRIAEKQEFAKMLGGLLWTSARADMNSAGTLGKIPIVRVYDILSSGGSNRSLMPTEHVGAVTSGTILHSQPGRVYLGHEGGFVSVWAADGGDGFPQCIEVIKVSVSDVLSLEGVNDRLWAGGRKGMISAYDVTMRPWVVTNCWMAHNDLPVMKLSVDHNGIKKIGRLRVISVGRDEQIRFWDGVLGSDWIGKSYITTDQVGYCSNCMRL